MVLESITANSGDKIELEKFNILVGPNNVGKTQTLRDIQAHMDPEDISRSIKVIEQVRLDTSGNLEDFLDGIPITIDEDASLELQVSPRVAPSKEHSYSGLHSNSSNLEYWEEWFNEGDHDKLLRNIAHWKVMFLDPESRLSSSATAEFESAPFGNAPRTLLHALLADEDGKEEQLRDAFSSTFDQDIVLDYSGMESICFRIGEEFDDLPEHPRKLNQELEEYPKLDAQGEGFRSFVSIVLSLLFSSGRVVLLDEPEAFLHPEQARRLGNWIAHHFEAIPGQVIIATHNSNILSGILSRTSDLSIIRLNRTGDNTYYHKMPADIVDQLRNDPLLSSQGILNTIFHRGVVVCEGDSDSIIYRTVAMAELNNAELFFIHAHDKTRIDRVSGLLNSGNIPVAAISDIDILKNETFDDVLQVLGTGSGLDEYNRRRERINDAIQSSTDGWYKVKNTGKTGAPGIVQGDLKELLEDAKNQGLFVVPVGEVEDWFGLGKNRSSAEMAIEAVERIKAGDTSEELVEFIMEIESYLNHEYDRLTQ